MSIKSSHMVLVCMMKALRCWAATDFHINVPFIKNACTFLSNTTNELGSKFWLTEKKLSLILSLYFVLSFHDKHCRKKLPDFNVKEAGCTSDVVEIHALMNLQFRFEICVEILVGTLPAGIKYLGSKCVKKLGVVLETGTIFCPWCPAVVLITAQHRSTPLNLLNTAGMNSCLEQTAYSPRKP